MEVNYRKVTLAYVSNVLTYFVQSNIYMAIYRRDTETILK